MRVLVLALAIALGGCCTERTATVEIEYEPFGPGTQDEFGLLDLEMRRNNGWACASDGAIRNAFGATIGERWVCTKCE